MSKSFNELTVTDLIDILKGVDKKTWVKIGVGLAIVVVLGIIFVKPAWIDRYANKQKIKGLKESMVTLDSLSHKRPELLRKKEELLEFITDSKERIFEKGKVSLLLGEVSKLADEAGVSIISSKPEQYKTKFPSNFANEYEGNLYTFTIEGGYHQLGSLVSKIEANRRLLRIESFRILSSKETAGKHQAELALTAVSKK